MAHRDYTYGARHNDLGMHVHASDGHGNDPTSCVLLNLCMIYMLKGIEESVARLTLCKMAGVRVNWVSLSKEGIFVGDVSPLALESAA
jgi:hypothetical protein